MTVERAIEILNPEHREHYESIEPVNEACRMGMKALEKQVAKKPKTKIDYDGTLWGEKIVGKYIYCPRCEKHIMSILNDRCVAGQKHKYCANCGQALDWSDTECMNG